MQESNGNFMWQPGPDRMVECWETVNIITLCEDWEDPDSRRIFETGPMLNEVLESAATVDIQTVAANERMPVELMSSTGIPEPKESKGFTINMNEVLESDQGVPVLVPGLSDLPIMETNREGSVHEAPKDEVNGAVMASTKDLKLPEVNA